MRREPRKHVAKRIVLNSAAQAMQIPSNSAAQTHVLNRTHGTLPKGMKRHGKSGNSTKSVVGNTDVHVHSFAELDKSSVMHLTKKKRTWRVGKGGLRGFGIGYGYGHHRGYGHHHRNCHHNCRRHHGGSGNKAVKEKEQPCFSDWTKWTECTRTCAKGHKSRERTRNRNDAACNYGESLESKDCNEEACPTTTPPWTPPPTTTPIPTTAAPKKADEDKRLILIGIIAGGVLLVAGGAVAASMMSGSKEKEKDMNELGDGDYQQQYTGQ